VPLDPVAERYANTIFVIRMEELHKAYIAQRTETIADLAKRGLGPDNAGRYHVEMVQLDIAHIEDLVNARVDTLLDAYERAHEPIDDGAVAHINGVAAQYCQAQANFLTRNIRTRIAQTRAPKNATEALIATVTTQAASIQARVLRRLNALRDEQIMAARANVRPLETRPLAAKKASFFHDPRVSIVLGFFLFGLAMFGLQKSNVVGTACFAICLLIYRAEILSRMRVVVPAVEIVLCCVSISYVVWTRANTPLSEDARKVPSLPSKYAPPNAPAVSKFTGDTSTHPTKPKPAPVLGPQTALQPQGANVGMSFYIQGGNPRFSIFNSGGEVAQQPKWSFALGDFTNEYYPHYPSDPSSSQPLPIPTDKVDDYVKPHSYLGNFAVFNDATANLIKSGDQIFGFATISCLNCAGSKSYWLYWEVGIGGWYADYTPLEKDAQLFKQGNLSRSEVDQRISRWIPASGRIPLKNGSPWQIDLTQP
jgi:hypothetical protein